MNFFAFDWITGCRSASLKRCVCNTAFPFSQSLSPDSRCQIELVGVLEKNPMLIFFFYHNILF